MGVGFTVEVCEPDRSQGKDWGRRHVIVPHPLGYKFSPQCRDPGPRGL